MFFQIDRCKWATGVRFGSPNTRSIVIGSRFEEFLRMIASGALFGCFLPLEDVTAVTATPIDFAIAFEVVVLFNTFQ